MEQQKKIFGITITEEILLKASDYFGIILLTVHWLLASVGMFFLVGVFWALPFMAFYDTERLVAYQSLVIGIIAAIIASMLGLIAYFYFTRLTSGIDALGKEKVPAQSKDHRAYARMRFFQSLIFLMIALPPFVIGYHLGLPVFTFIFLFFLLETIYVLLHLSGSLMLEMSLLGYYRFHQVEQTSARIIKFDAFLKFVWPVLFVGAMAATHFVSPFFLLLLSGLMTFLIIPIIINGLCLGVIHLKATPKGIKQSPN